MTWKIFVACLKTFQCRVQWWFLFWKIFFRFGDIDVFVLCKLATWWRHMIDQLKMRKYWFNNISGNIHKVIFKLAIINLSQKGRKLHLSCCCHNNGLLLVFFKYKLKFPCFFTTKIIYTKNISWNLSNNVGSTSVGSGKYFGGLQFERFVF